MSSANGKAFFTIAWGSKWQAPVLPTTTGDGRQPRLTVAWKPIIKTLDYPAAITQLTTASPKD